MDGDLELLERFKPSIRYDSLEAFFADSPAEMTDNPGNRLLGAKNGAPSQLSLQSLGPGPGREAERLSIHGKDYRSQYVRLIGSRPDELRDRVFGHVHTLDQDTKWLQYWFFYFYDDPSLAAGLGAHEGDWEMIQVRVQRVRADEWEADEAVYAQHKYASRRKWDDVNREPPGSDTPLVYSARGSHASYFEPGLYDTEWFDIADGEGPLRPELTLVVMHDETQSPGWAYWPGLWGDTEPGKGSIVTRLLSRVIGLRAALRKLQQRSPEAPCRHASWSDPEAFYRGATEREPVEPVERKPQLKVTFKRRGSRLRYEYDAPADWGGTPATLLVTVSGDPQRPLDDPQRTFTIDLRGRRHGRGTVPWLKLEDRAYDVTTSFRDAKGRSSVPFRTEVDKDPARWHLHPFALVGYPLALAVQPLWQLKARLRKLKQVAAAE